MKSALRVLLCLSIFLLATSFKVKKHACNSLTDPPFVNNSGAAWVDSVFKTLTPDERIGQLFMVAAYSNRDAAHVEQISNLISTYDIGGLIFFQGGPIRQAVQTNLYQSKAKTPLLIAMDAEWGLAMRIDSTIRFPKQMTLGAINGSTLVYQMGADIARQCRRLGVHVNFAPVVDVNNNPNNPVINMRSFGENKYNVTEKGIAYMKGMQENGVLANAKHFPGHGDTETDSHLGLPAIYHSKEEMDTMELYPFRALIDSGLGSMMVAHMYIPSFDSTKNRASTLSYAVVTDCLQNGLCFNGLIFTDALNMKGVSAFYEPGVVDVKALIAGNDVLLFSEDVPRAIKEIKKGIARKEISQEEIDRRVKKILSAKYWSGLNNYKPIDLYRLYEDLNKPSSVLLDYKLFESSLTLLRNKEQIIPFHKLDQHLFAALALNDTAPNPFQKMLSNYAPFDLFQLPKESAYTKADSLVKKMAAYSTVCISVHSTNTNPEKNFGITPQMVSVINSIRERSKVILTIFGNPYTLSKIEGADKCNGLLMGFEDLELPQSLAAQLLFGAIPAQGRLPVTASNNFKLGDGIMTEGGLRLKYTIPEEVGIRSADLLRLDTLATRAIQREATPGCQILVAKDGKVIYQKSFGFHTYPKTFVKQEIPIPVKNTDIYDIASVTKIAGSALAVMDLTEKGQLEMDKKLPRYLPDLKNSNKKEISLREVYTHQSGLASWIPFWTNTVSSTGLMPQYYRTTAQTGFTTRVAENVYLRNDYKDSIWSAIINSPVKEPGKYVYSDLGLILTRKIIEDATGTRMDSFLMKKFYAPLGLGTIGYLPRSRFPLSRIVPTEEDKKFRMQLIHGDVHDPAAAMLGGISGHAGLFSDASDLAVIMQMLLNKGKYGGEKYFEESTVAQFTKKQFEQSENRRGLLFDKPETDFTKSSPAARSASGETFGHTGFTGTCMWADPESNIVFVFLSNRVNPDAAVNKLADQNVRTDMQQAVYDAVRLGKGYLK